MTDEPGIVLEADVARYLLRLLYLMVGQSQWDEPTMRHAIACLHDALVCIGAEP